MQKTYSKRFGKIIKIIGNLASVFGADFFKEDYHMYWWTWSVVLLINIAITFTLYTTYTTFKINNSWIEILQCMCMFGTGVQGYAKLINVIRCDNIHRYFCSEMIDMYVTNEQKTEEFQNHLRKALSLQTKLFAILFAMYTVAMIGVIGVPIYYIIFFNERLFIMPFFVPFVNPYTEFGYNLTFALHLTCVIFGTYGNFCCFIVVAHIPLQKNILRSKFNELDRELSDNLGNFKSSKRFLNDILHWHQKYLIFTKTTREAFHWVIFTQIATAFLGIVCTMICIFVNVWPAAPVYLVYSFVNLYIFCGLGNLIELANDDIILMIYDSMWYLLKPPEQKMIQMMLREAQNTTGMTIGDISPLSLNTALQLTKTIYTVSMMFNQFLN